MPESPVRSLYLGQNARPWQGVEAVSTSQQHPLGTFFDDEFGRRFRYSLNGAVALIAGDIVQSALLGGALTTLQTVGIIGAVTPAGATKIPVAALTTTQVANTFDEGWCALKDTSDVASYLRRIKTQPALVHTTWVDAYLELYEGFPVALAVNDTLAMMVNPYKGILISAVTATIQTGMILGGVCCAVPIANYCWVQTKGLFATHIKDGALAVNPVCQAGTTAGTLTTNTAALYCQQIGFSYCAWADEGAGIIHLNCE